MYEDAVARFSNLEVSMALYFKISQFTYGSAFCDSNLVNSVIPCLYSESYN
jgi:hypothetical protein